MNTSDAVEAIDSENTQTFDITSDQLVSSAPLITDASCDEYLRITVGQPLSGALAFALIRRPEDPIEFIAQYLIDWSRRKARQTSIEEERSAALALIDMERRQSLLRDQQREDMQRQAIEHKQKQRQEIFLQYDKHVYASFHCNFPIDPRTDDEREPASRFPKELEHMSQPLFHQAPRPAQIHTHETGSDAEERGTSTPTTRRCQETNSSSLSYFSQLKERIIACDDS